MDIHQEEAYQAPEAATATHHPEEYLETNLHTLHPEECPDQVKVTHILEVEGLEEAHTTQLLTITTTTVHLSKSDMQLLDKRLIPTQSIMVPRRPTYTSTRIQTANTALC